MSAQDPVIVGTTYVLQPDLALLRLKADFYASAAPTPADCLLVIEVGDTSADFGRQIKMPRYARGGVAELWLVDINRDVVVVCRDPVGDAYQRVQVVRRGESIALEVASGALVSVQSILG